MTFDEMKKMLYKLKPTAEFTSARKGFLNYAALVGVNPNGYNEYIHFIVPFQDIGDAIFMDRMPAQNLIIYMVAPPSQENNSQDQEPDMSGYVNQ